MADTAADPIQLLCLDVDGVLTDGAIVIDDLGQEAKRFHVRDGTGIRIWMSLGYEVALITGRRGMAVRHRANELGIRYVLQGCADKCAACASILKNLKLGASQAAMIGDDLPDLPLMRIVGYPMAVADAVPAVRDAASFVTLRPGGHAAVREAIEHVLHAQNRWEEAIRDFG